ncbi:ATPase, partial [Halolamina salina]
GSGERRYAYARNRTLRKAGVIEHDGAGRYRYALPDLVREAFDGNAAAGTVTDAVEAIETATDID